MNDPRLIGSARLSPHLQTPVKTTLCESNLRGKSVRKKRNPGGLLLPNPEGELSNESIVKLTRPLAKFEGLGLKQQTADFILLGARVAAKDLHAIERILNRRLARTKFRHAAFQRSALNARILHPAESIYEQARLLGSAHHVRDLLLDHLELTDLTPECFSFHRIRGGQIETALGLPNAPSRHGETARIQR